MLFNMVLDDTMFFKNRFYTCWNYLVNCFRPLARRLLRISCPSLVCILFRKPCFLLPLIIVGVVKFFFIICKLYHTPFDSQAISLYFRNKKCYISTTTAKLLTLEFSTTNHMRVKSPHFVNKNKSPHPFCF